MYEIKTSAFCGLSRSKDWQNWLEETAPDLHASLMTTVGSAVGCRANSNKMMDIYFDLNKRGLEPQLITFLKRRFPWIIKGEKPTQQPSIVFPTQRVQNYPKDWASYNKHGVFGVYRPDILSFPQKLIIIDSPDRLMQRVQHFAQDKLAVDYIIIDDRAYIEYFDSKYAMIVDKFPRDSRDIYKYRLKIQHAE